MDVVVFAERKIFTARATASSKFGGYRPQAEQPVKALAVNTNTVVETFKAAWSRCDPDADYEHYAARLRPSSTNRGYSAKDIEEFSLALFEFQNETGFSKKAGLFLSALANNCRDDKVVIQTFHLGIAIDYLGYYNTKEIIVADDAGDFVGTAMKGGTLIVKGNAGKCVGLLMEGGEIHIHGDCGYIAVGFKGDRIFHKGKQIAGE